MKCATCWSRNSIARWSLAVDLELDLDRVGPEEDEPVGGGVLGQGQGAAVHVDDQGRVPVEAVELLGAHPVAAPVLVQRLERPAPLEPEALGDPGDVAPRPCRRAVVALVVLMNIDGVRAWAST